MSEMEYAPLYERELRIWQRDRVSRVVRDDLRDLEQVREIWLIEQLVDLLPDRIGSQLSIRGLREDLEVEHKTVAFDVLRETHPSYPLRFLGFFSHLGPYALGGVGTSAGQKRQA